MSNADQPISEDAFQESLRALLGKVETLAQSGEEFVCGSELKRMGFTEGLIKAHLPLPSLFRTESTVTSSFCMEGVGQVDAAPTVPRSPLRPTANQKSDFCRARDANANAAAPSVPRRIRVGRPTIRLNAPDFLRTYLGRLHQKRLHVARF
jgi:hypothetical protein